MYLVCARQRLGAHQFSDIIGRQLMISMQFPRALDLEGNEVEELNIGQVLHT